MQGTRGCVFRGCVDRLARLPAIGPNSVCISLWWQLEVSRVRTRWLRGSLVSRRHLSSCCSLEATANPLSSSSFSFCLYPHLLLLLLQPCRNPSQGNHASKEREGRRSGKSIGAFWRYANAAGYPWVETRLCYRDSNMLIDRRDGYLYGMNEVGEERGFDR